jgi:Cellulase (glycosyl hydrolase family 5)
MKKFVATVIPALVAAVFLCVYLSKAAVQLTPPSQPIPPSYFGMHFVAGNTPWPNVPVGSWRLWDTSTRWPDIEPSKGHWNFNGLDKAIGFAQQHDTDVLLTLAVTPQWASAHPDLKSGWQQPGLTSEPTGMDDWRAFVTQVATRYKGRIHGYEIWNEPNLKQYWMGNTDQLIALTREAYNAVKAVDPNALIVSPAATTSGGIGWLDEFLHKGGGQYVDVIGYHFYVFPQPPEAMADLIQRVKQTMQKNGVGNKPLWGTEIGWAEPKPFPSDEMGAAYVARAYTISWAAGVSRLYWYAWDNHKWAALQTTEPDNQTLKPAGRADGIIQQWMSGARMDWCNKGDDNTWNCQLERNGAKEWIVWNASGTKGFSVPSSWHATAITPLLGQPQPLSGSKVQIGPTPALVTAASQ